MADRDDGSNDEGEAPKPKRKPAASGEAAKAKKARRESEGGAPAKPTGFTREHVVTPELAAWLDRKTVSRPELTRFFWAYIKERGLQVRSGHLQPSL